MGKNTADIDACVSEIFYHSQKMEGSVPSPFYYKYHMSVKASVELSDNAYS